jgi:hypothetical protein
MILSFKRTRLVCTTIIGAAAVFAVPMIAQQEQAPPPPTPAGQEGQPQQDAAEELTRGPIHEAFAGPVVFNPKPGVIVPKAPPAPIEELPPDQKPEGDVIWINGYWWWDEERNDFIWISGIWRDPPPGMTWMPGYWTEVEGGSQWVSGHWQAADQEEVEFLPEPPQSLENGPNIPAPDDSHFWVPGTYVWRDGYRWQGGYWTVHHPGWVWKPARYYWTPTGYVFVAGFWDAPFETCGVMFAPVHFRHRVRYYTPSIVLNVGAVSAHLFCRPHHHHYVFGDYYDPIYVNAGYTPWFQFSSTRFGYDPYFHYYRCHFRRDNPRWHITLRSNYDLVRRDPSFRPPRTFLQQTNIVNNITNVNNVTVNNIVNNVTVNNISNNRVNAVAMGTPLNRAVQNNAFTNIKVAKIDERERRQIQTVSHKTRDLSAQRRTLEQTQLQTLRASGGAAAPGRKGAPVQLKQPVKVKLDSQVVSNLSAGASKTRLPSANVGTGAAGKGGAGVKTGTAATGTPGGKTGGVVGQPGGRKGDVDVGRPGGKTMPPGKTGGVTGQPGGRKGDVDVDRPGGNTMPPATKPPATKPPATRPPETKPPATRPPETKPPMTKPPATKPPATKPPPGSGSGGSPPAKKILPPQPPPKKSLPPQPPPREKEKEKKGGGSGSSAFIDNQAAKQAQIAAQQRSIQQSQQAAQQRAAQQQAAQQQAAQRAAQQKAAQQAQMVAQQQAAQKAAQQQAAQQQAAQRAAQQQAAQRAAQQQAAQQAAAKKAAEMQRQQQQQQQAQRQKQQQEEEEKKKKKGGR